MITRAWVDGAIVDADAPHVSVLDHAFTVGDAVFETLKVVSGTPFALTRHLRRLARSAEGLGLPAPSEPLVRAAVAEVLGPHGLPALARLRITYGGGIGPIGSGRTNTPPHLAVTVGAAVPWPTEVGAVTVPWVRNERSAIAGLKTTSYAENVVALAHANARGASEALFANTSGALCEGSGSNVFVVLGDSVLTPPLGSGCLAGITRELVLAWTTAREADLTLDDLAAADEVFLTSSTRDVQPVALLDGRPLLGSAGAATRAVSVAFAQRAGEDLDP